jgi:hypothetical protein
MHRHFVLVDEQAAKVVHVFGHHTRTHMAARTGTTSGQAMSRWHRTAGITDQRTSVAGFRSPRFSSCTLGEGSGPPGGFCYPRMIHSHKTVHPTVISFHHPEPCFEACFWRDDLGLFSVWEPEGAQERYRIPHRRHSPCSGKSPAAAPRSALDGQSRY